MERKELDSWLTIDYQLNVTSVKGASLATEEILYGVRGRLLWDKSETVSSFNRWSFGERKTKKGFLAMHGFKLNFHRCIGQLRRLPPPHQKTPWRRLFVHNWRAWEDDDCVHAKRNDKDVPQSSAHPGPENRKASHSVVSP